MDDREATSKSGSSSISMRVSTGKDLVVIFRDLSLIFLVALTLIWPEKLNDVLVRAGFEEGSFAGLRWKAQFSKQDSSLVSAQATIDDLRMQNAKLKNALSEAKVGLNNDGLKERILNLEQVNEELTLATNKVQTSLQTTISSNSGLVKKLQTTTSNITPWAVVYSGSNNLKTAKKEIQAANSNFGIRNAKIYYRQGSYRSVVIPTDRVEANQLLTKLKQKWNDAYIVNMSDWCRQPNEAEDFITCKNI